MDKKLINIVRIILALLPIWLVACSSGQKIPSTQVIQSFVKNYPLNSNDVIRSVTKNKIVIMVNLWSHHNLVDEIRGEVRDKFYTDLATKLVDETLAKQNQEDKTKLTLANVDFVYIKTTDEYGKPDFTSLQKKAQVQFIIQDSTLTHHQAIID